MELTITVLDELGNRDITGDYVQFVLLDNGEQQTFTFAKGAFETKPPYGNLTVYRSTGSIAFQGVPVTVITNGNTGVKFGNASALQSFIESLDTPVASDCVSRSEFLSAIAALQAQISQGGGGTTPTPQLATPNPTAMPDSYSVYISWPAVPNATSYVVKRDGVVVYTGASLDFTDTNLSASTAYGYGLTASATGYLSSTATINTTTSAAPVVVPGNNTLPYQLPFQLAA